MCNHFAKVLFVLAYSISGLSNTFIYLCYLKPQRMLRLLRNCCFRRMRATFSYGDSSAKQQKESVLICFKLI